MWLAQKKLQMVVTILCIVLAIPPLFFSQHLIYSFLCLFFFSLLGGPIVSIKGLMVYCKWLNAFQIRVHRHNLQFLLTFYQISNLQRHVILMLDASVLILISVITKSLEDWLENLLPKNKRMFTISSGRKNFTKRKLLLRKYHSVIVKII